MNNETSTSIATDGLGRVSGRCAGSGLGRGPADPEDPPATAAIPVPRPRRGAADRDAPTDAVERLLALIRDELGRTDPAPPDRDRAGPLVARRRATTWRPRRRPSPTGSNGPCTACCRPPGRSPRRRSSSGWPRCSTAPTSPTRGWSGPASRAIAAWPARRTGWSPATTCCAAARSTRTCSATIADGGPPARHAPLDRPSRADAPAGHGRPSRRPARPRRGAALPRRDRSGRGGRCRGRCDLVRPGQGRLPVRGRVDRDAGRDPPATPRPDPAERRPDPVPCHRPGAGRARPVQARPIAVAAGGARGRDMARRPLRPAARVPGPRPARPGGPGAVPRPPARGRRDGRSRCRCFERIRAGRPSAWRARLRRQRHTERGHVPRDPRRRDRDPARHRPDARRRPRRALLGGDPRAGPDHRHVLRR